MLDASEIEAAVDKGEDERAALVDLCVAKKLEAAAAPTTAAGGALVLRIEHDERTVYEGPFGAMADVSQDVGWVAARGESTFTFTVSLPAEAVPFSAGGQPATASYAWETTP